MWARKAKNSRSSDAYDQAIDRAALMLLAALRDHANPQYSSVQLEALRLRGIGKNGGDRAEEDARGICRHSPARDGLAFGGVASGRHCR